MKVLNQLLEKSRQSNAIWALWNWNGLITENTIVKQIADFNKAGINGVIIRPLKSVSPKYLSKEFIELYTIAMDKAKENSIDIMIGDDFYSLADTPFAQNINLKDENKATRLVLSENVLLESGETFTFEPSNKKEYIVATPINENGKITIDGAKCIYDGEKELSTKWKATKGHWKLFRFTVENVQNRDGDFVPDFFSIKAAQSYINNVLEPLFESTKGKLPKPIKAILCEMPPITVSKNGIPWSDELFVSKYRSRFKKNLITTLPVLFSETLQSEAKYRPHIVNFIQDTLVERFPLTINKWAQSKKIDTWFITADSDDSDTISSIPILYSNGGELSATVHGLRNENTQNVATLVSEVASRNKKDTSSVAIVNRNRHMKSGSLSTIKSEVEEHIVQGADKIIIDGFYTNLDYKYSISAPHGIVPAHPDFDKLPSLITTIKNLLAISTNAIVGGNKIALLAPPLSAIADYTCENSSTYVKANELVLEAIAYLEMIQTPYTLVTENDLIDSKVNSDGTVSLIDSEIVIDTIILPYSRLINNSLFVQIEKFSAKKGTVIFIDQAPQGSFDDGIGSSFVSRIEKIVKSRTRNVYISKIDDIIDHLPKQYSDLENIIVSETSLLGFSADYFHYDKSDSHAIFMKNVADKQFALSVPRFNEHHFYQFIPETGKLCKVEEEFDKEAPFEVVINPNETAILFASNEAPGQIHSGNLQVSEYQYRVKLKNSKWEFEPLSINIFPLTRLNTRLSIDRNSGMLSNHFETNFEVSLKEIDGFLVFFKSDTISEEGNNNNFKVLLNGTELHRVHNIKEIAEEMGSHIFFAGEENLLVYSLGGILEKGNNSVRIVTNNLLLNPNPLTFPPFIAINAPVEQTPKGWRVIVNKEENSNFEWGGKGYPYMVGYGKYTQSFEVPDGVNKAILTFENVSGSVEISLNGEVIDNLLWPPYRLDITSYLSKKRNDISITISNSLSPIYALNGKESGILGEIFLEIY